MNFYTLSIFIFFYLTSSCINLNSNLKRAPNTSDQSKPRHIIITVHGLSGNAETFGDFAEVATQHLQSLNSNYNVEVDHFVYPTGQSENYGIQDFAFDPHFGLSQFVRSKFKTSPLNPNDKISFVVHSQGGIVTYYWFFKTLLEQNFDFKFISHIDSIITLGTPFWGSKIASILTDKRNIDIIPLIKALAPDNMKMTRKEITELAFGSDTIHNFRSLAIKMDNDSQLIEKIKALKVRLINITGILPKEPDQTFKEKSNQNADFKTLVINFIYNLFKKSYISNQRVESDLAVPVTSSRWNFIYAMTSPITQDTTIKKESFKHFNHLINQSRYIFTESTHMPFETNTQDSMAYIDKICLTPEKCTHPTYRYILYYLADCKNNDCNQSSNEAIIEKMKSVNAQEYDEFKKISSLLEGFAIQINIQLPPGGIDSLPVQYFREENPRMGEPIGFENWKFLEYSILHSILDLKIDPKTRMSIASNQNQKIVLADPKETRSIDIVSKKWNSHDLREYIRINVFGRIDQLGSQSQQKAAVPIEIKLPGYPVVKVDVLVQTSYSTYLDLDFSQYKIK